MKIYIYSDNYVVHAYDANDYDHQIISGTLSMEFNRSGSLTFVVPPNNEAHKNGWIKDLKSVICVKNLADDFEWYGRVLNRQVDFMGCCTYTCEGALGRLNDMVAYPITNVSYYKYQYHQDNVNIPYTESDPCPDLYKGSAIIFKALISQYNDRLRAFNDIKFDYYDESSPSKDFIASSFGTIDHLSHDDMDIKNPQFENMLDFIQNNILNAGTSGFHIEVGRRESEGEEYDLLFFKSNYPEYLDAEDGSRKYNFRTSSKAVIFGKNLTNLTYRTDYSDVCTAMHFRANIAIDCLEVSGTTTKKQTRTVTREWVYPLEDANGAYDPSIDGNGYVAKYGLVMVHEEIESRSLAGAVYVLEGESEVSINEKVNGKANEIASSYFHTIARARANQLMRSQTETIEFNGIDITDSDDTIPFRVNYYIPVISDFHNIKAKYLCTQVTLDLCNPGNNQFILGAKPDGASENWASIAKRPLDDVSQYYL